MECNVFKLSVIFDIYLKCWAKYSSINTWTQIQVKVLSLLVFRSKIYRLRSSFIVDLQETEMGRNSPATLLSSIPLRHQTLSEIKEIKNNPSLKSAGDREKEVMERSEREPESVRHWNEPQLKAKCKKMDECRWSAVCSRDRPAESFQVVFTPCSCLLLHSHELFVWHYLHFRASLYPMFITNVGVCLSASCIYWLQFCDVHCLCLSPSVQRSYQYVTVCLSLVQCCRLLLSSCCSATIETLVAQPLPSRYHISCSRFPQWLRTGPLSSSLIISSPCRLQAVVQQLDSEANERATFTFLSVRNRDIPFDLIHVWIHMCILKPASCLLTSATKLTSV